MTVRIADKQRRAKLPVVSNITYDNLGITSICMNFRNNSSDFIKLKTAASMRGLSPDEMLLEILYQWNG